MNPRASASKPAARRCAIYTRVSTDHGLEQDFNSLDAQREACTAYVKSQTQEGWGLIATRFDDGGFSGANLERPALQTLLEAIKQRRIDVVVVYKVDRLTRSLVDFAKLIELFDGHGVSFISITQSFNATTSMGRLTLNMLLSFAQFEREVTGERIRDKIAASKKKGIWVGGVVPLGYRVEHRKLVVDEDEAGTVRLIFDRYLSAGSMLALMRELNERGILTRKRRLSSGKIIGGIPFTKGPLAYLLKNRMYLGEINHGRHSYPGEHPAIVDRDLFEAVQARLAAQATTTGYRRSRSEALLIGKLFDDCGHRMTPSFAIKRGVRYRYYVSRATTEGRPSEAGTITRVPAPDVERAVLDALTDLFPNDGADGTPTTADRSFGKIGPANPGSSHGDDTRKPRERVGVPSSGGGRNSVQDRRIIDEMVDRVTVEQSGLAIALNLEAAANGQSNRVLVPWSKPPTRVGRELIPPANCPRDDTRAVTSETRSNLLAAIAKARAYLDDLVAGRVLDIAEIAAREERSVRSASMLLSLAFLAPDLVRAIVERRLPRRIGLTRMMDLPADWVDQHQALGLHPNLF
jgi:site-specific DNA recombinase